jgi:pimeloyl-ACP methyl ester carboxylesterase
MCARQKAIKSDPHGLVSASGGEARTIVYVHGIGNKPLPDVLKCQWDDALFGFSLGEKSRLAYWVNRLRYPVPSTGSCKSGDSNLQPGARPASIRTAGLKTDLSQPSLAEFVDEISEGTERPETESLKRIVAEIEDSANRQTLEQQTSRFRAKILPGRKLRDWVTRHLTGLFLYDVYDYFFDAQQREVMRDSVRRRLTTGGDPFVVVGHSQGSMIAYDVLIELSGLPDPPRVDLFLTIGSPLGIREVQDQIQGLTNQPSGLSVPSIVRRWINVSDPLDPVCADKRLGNDIASNSGVAIKDIVDWNEDSPEDPHSGTGYLSMPDVRHAVQATVQRELFQRVAPFILARDLVRNLENAHHDHRQPVLIELRDVRRLRSGAVVSEQNLTHDLADVRKEVLKWIDSNILENLSDSKHAISAATADHSQRDLDVALDLERELRNYVSVNLTRGELERLASSKHQGLPIHRIYRNARKKSLLLDSAKIVQAPTAHRGYDAVGRGIIWAVLDTGIDPDHPHFKKHQNILEIWDCLQVGKPRRLDPAGSKKLNLGIDHNGHGSHVAGIIAGEYEVAGNPPQVMTAIAPMCKVVSYKVLADDGSGSDAKIIKAIEHIYERNRNATALEIHGVNLSLGGSFDPESFGCGDSPICERLRELWRQGVVVVLAAGNEGFLEINSQGEDLGLNMDLSIGDPANLAEALAVGSVHKLRPHHYGVSYFSSRGPTADGRPKPDLVAPGERILSCRAQGRGKKMGELYVEFSGTSMAAPHVSGVIAAFLSARREFIGFPERVKKSLLINCTDLERDRMHQGAGIPNLVKMLLNT